MAVDNDNGNDNGDNNDEVSDYDKCGSCWFCFQKYVNSNWVATGGSDGK